jgi:hypothetical protein
MSEADRRQIPGSTVHTSSGQSAPAIRCPAVRRRPINRVVRRGADRGTPPPRTSPSPAPSTGHRRRAPAISSSGSESNRESTSLQGLRRLRLYRRSAHSGYRGNVVMTSCSAADRSGSARCGGLRRGRSPRSNREPATHRREDCAGAAWCRNRVSSRKTLPRCSDALEVKAEPTAGTRAARYCQHPPSPRPATQRRGSSDTPARNWRPKSLLLRPDRMRRPTRPTTGGEQHQDPRPRQG